MKRFIYFSGARRSIVGHGMVTPASAIGFAAAAPAAIPPAQHSVYLRGSVRDTGDSSSVASMSSSLSMPAAMATSGGGRMGIARRPRQAALKVDSGCGGRFARFRFHLLG
jgi:hypothetical protein